jgi:transcriptional regulator GlxA family with amidase domain
MTVATNSTPIEPTPGAPVKRRVVIVTFDAAQILDVTGPLEVFSSASRFLPAVRYSTQVVTTRGGPVHASCGLEFASSPVAELAGPIDTLLVAGGVGMDAAAADTELLAQVRRLATDARRVTSVCSGAFVLAAAGLLAGRLPPALRRPTQYSALLAGQTADTEPVRDLLSWLRDHLTNDLSVPALARQINLSERQFTRVFKAEVGATAADHVEAVRLESACRLLETTNRTIEQVARTCGFGTPETMNRTFRRRLGTTPGEHRHHFRGDTPVLLVP